MKDGTTLKNMGFIRSLGEAILLILISELADKTFFIAAVMSMKHPRLTVFAGAIGALAIMTILSGKFFFFNFNCYKKKIFIYSLKTIIILFSCFWTCYCYSSSCLYIVHFICFICIIWFEDVERWILHVTK